MRLGLVGNPNVGKSVIFNQLTGIGVEVSNYPGTTIDLHRGNICFQREKLELIDLPGVYSLDGTTDEEQMVSTFVRQGDADVLIAVLDAVHLERNLYLLIQIIEYGRPMVVVLNMMDEAQRKGISIDTDELARILGLHIIPTTAVLGKNTSDIITAALSSARPSNLEVSYDHHVEAAIRSLMSLYAVSRVEAIEALLGYSQDRDLRDAVSTLSEEIEKPHQMSVHQIIAGNRHHCARQIAGRVIQMHDPHHHSDPDRYLTKIIPGLPLLIALLTGILILVFFIGSWLEALIVEVLNIIALQPILAADLPPLLQQIATSVVLGLQAGLGIALPFIFTFYLFISVLEDSGYLTRAAFLTDRTMHRLGMHGQGIIPLVLGFGCTVPALMSIKLLTTRRERTIAAFLVTLIPCSARTVIIAGIVAAFVGIAAALSIYLLILVIIIITGLILSKMTPGEQMGMIMEMAPLRTPQLGNVLSKSWLRVREFLIIAMPLLVLASIVLGILQYFGIFAAFEEMIASFSMAILGLPPYAVTALIFGILRKEMALETLVILSGTANLDTVMSSAQLYIFAVVSVLFVPCISTIAVLYKQLGARMAVIISFYTLLAGILTGAVINLLIK